MIKYKEKLSTDQSKNAFSKELTDRAERRLINIKHLDVIKEKLANLECKNEDHKQLQNFVEVDIDGVVYLDLCCKKFKLVVKDRLKS